MGGPGGDRGPAPGPADRRRDPGGRRQGARRRELRRGLSGLARPQRPGGAGPGARRSRISCATAAGSGSCTRTVEDHASSGLSRRSLSGGGQVRGRWDAGHGDLPAGRRGLAHRRRLRPGALQGDAALRAGGAEPRRRHAVRQHVRGVRGAAASAEAAARGTARGLQLRRPPEGHGPAQRGGSRLDAGLPSDHPRPIPRPGAGRSTSIPARSCASRASRRPRATT